MSYRIMILNLGVNVVISTTEAEGLIQISGRLDKQQLVADIVKEVLQDGSHYDCVPDFAQSFLRSLQDRRYSVQAYRAL